MPKSPTTITSEVTLTIPVTITAGEVVAYAGYSTAASVVDGYGPGTLVNFGTINGFFASVSLDNGGYIDNQAGGLITGQEAIEITGSGQSTILNNGVIDGALVGVYLAQGTLTNGMAGQIYGGVHMGNGTVTNFGTDNGSINFSNGGTLNNADHTAVITAFNAVGVDISGGAGQVLNQGNISSVYLEQGGGVLNTGYIGGVSTEYGIVTRGTAVGYIYNTGTILGIDMTDGGGVVNQSGGLISGYTDGVSLAGSGLVSNSGTILGTGGRLSVLPGVAGNVGVSISGGADLVNNLTSSVIKGTKDGVDAGNAPGNIFISNHGSIIGGKTGGTAINETGTGNDTIINYGVLSGQYAVKFGAGKDILLLKAGSTLAGIVAGGSGSNEVEFAYGSQGITLTNLNAKFIDIGTFLNVTPTLSMAGSNTLAPTTTFDNARILLNDGSFNVFGTFINTGTFEGGLTLGGQYLPVLAPDPSAADIFNAASAVISGTAATLIAANPYAGFLPVTIENAGTIADTATGGTAVAFNGSLANLLIDDPGSVFIGQVDGGNGSGSTLELGNGTLNGTISGIGTSFTNFHHISVATDGTWHVEASTITSIIDSGTVYFDTSDALTGSTIDIEVGGDLIFESGPPAAPGTKPVGAAVNVAATAASSPYFDNVTIGVTSNATIDLSGVTYDPHGAVNLTYGNTLILIENGGTNTIHLSPSQSLSSDYFHLASDGFNGTNIVESNVPCFLAGSKIRTPGGYRLVEELAIGDLVVSTAGFNRPIKWIGRRSYLPPYQDNPDLIPVRIKAGALSDNIPEQDLYLSPLHALMIDNYLVPAGALVNDISILPCPDLARIDYYHIETEHHDIIFANNTPVETFIDESSRNMFDNAEEFYRLYPNSLRSTSVLFAPRLEFGGALERIRQRTALRAGVLLNHAKDTQLVGYLEFADRNTITGWAYAPAQPNIPVSLDILNGGAMLARTIANMPRPDVKNAGFGNGRYGFSITLPAALPMLFRHEISIRLSGGTALLAGSPIVIDPGVPAELLRTGGLQSLIDAAFRGANSLEQANLLGNTLEMAGKKIQIAALGGFAQAAKRGAGHAEKPVVLVLDEAWPTIKHDAGSNAVLSHITAFQALGYTVVFCATGGAPKDNAAQSGCIALQEQGVICHGQDGEPAERVIRELAETRLDVVYLHRLAAASAYAGLVKHHTKTAYVIYSIADIHALRLERQAEVTGRPDLRIKARAVQAAELWAMQVADCVITHSSFEAEYLRQSIPHINVKVVPWAVPTAKPATTRTRADIAFVGGAEHAPNLDAVKYLADAIMPEVWAVDPTIKCLIAGPGWESYGPQRLDSRIVRLGHQPSLVPLMNSVKLTVAPLRFGAGIKGKVLDSMAAGTPCVMSSMAAEGMALSAPLAAMVADGAEFARNILKIYGSQRAQREASKAGLAFIEAHHSPAQVITALADALGNIPVPIITMRPAPRRSKPAQRSRISRLAAPLENRAA